MRSNHLCHNCTRLTEKSKGYDTGLIIALREPE